MKQYRADAAIVTEPTELDVCVAHKGFAWLEVETFGKLLTVRALISALTPS